MKKMLIIAITAFTLSCNSSGSNNNSGDSTSDIKPAQNVNGNIPDTSNAGPITGNKKDSVKVDSSRKDSMPRR